MNFIRTTFKSHLPPSMSTYGKSKPLSRAQEQDLGFVHFPLQSHPEALGGMITFLATWTDLIYLKPIISKLNHWQRQHRLICLIYLHANKQEETNQIRKKKAD